MNWSKDQDDALASIVQAGPATWDDIARALETQLGLSVSPDAVRNRARRLRLSRPELPPPTAAEKFGSQVIAERERLAASALKRELSAAVTAQARWEEFIDITREGLAQIPGPLVERVDYDHTSSGDPETMVVMISDSHVGKLVDPMVVGPTFGYDANRYLDRIARLERKIVRLLDLHRQHATIQRLVLLFLGDGVDGTDMRRGQPHRNDIQSAVQQSIILATTFGDMTVRLANLVTSLDVFWQYGNHGRVGDFGVNLPVDNWDYVAGMFVQQRVDLAGPGNVRVVVPTTKYGIYDVEGMRIYAAHGDGVRAGNSAAGVPIGGIVAQANKNAGLHKQLFDLVTVGHWHQAIDFDLAGTRVLVNGPWDEGDDFSVNQITKASEPTQWAFGVSPKSGLTWQYQIRLAPRRASTPLTVEA